MHISGRCAIRLLDRLRVQGRALDGFEIVRQTGQAQRGRAPPQGLMLGNRRRGGTVKRHTLAHHRAKPVRPNAGSLANIDGVKRLQACDCQVYLPAVYAPASHFFMKLVFAAPDNFLPSLATALASQVSRLTGSLNRECEAQKDKPRPGRPGLKERKAMCGVSGMPSVQFNIDHVDGGFAAGASSFSRHGSPRSLSCATVWSATT
jgi:hypothetical protein